MSKLLQTQLVHNEQSASAWEVFRSHRQHVTNFLCGSVSGGKGELVVLGAGNCNDLDLKQLTKDYAHVTLIDIDRVALGRALDIQDCGSLDGIKLIGDLDLSGVVGELERGDVEAALQTAANVTFPLSDRYHTVASACMLSQLVDSIVHAIGEEHPLFLRLVTAIRLRHLRLMLELTKPGGVAWLFTDFVSSLTAPELLEVDDPDLPQLATQLIAKQNFFTGLNPFVVRQLFDSDAALASMTSSVELLQPWLWNLGPRTYAVYGLRAERS